MRIAPPATPRKSRPRTNAPDASRAHSHWVRAHPRIDDSAFPEYPDEKPRRGASRGALPNGNPWQPEDPDEKPGPPWARSSEPAASSVSRGARTTREPRSRRVVAPPRVATRVAVAGSAPTRADRRIAEDIETRLAQSKKLEGCTIEVHVHGEDVFLRGSLPTLAAKIEAGLIASTARGVARVHNQIRTRA
jgi:hypothetical protein